VQRRGGTGNTTGSRVKALLLYVQQRHGRAEADAFLLSTKLDRDFLEDETRALSLELWHAALVAFTSRFGRDAIVAIAPTIVDPENLGVWTRVLRGAGDAATAYRQLDHYGGEEVLTDRWRTLECRPGYWRGGVPLRADAEHEKDGLCALARAAELAAVPILFGLRPATVRGLAGDHERSGTIVQELEAEWHEPGRRLVLVGAAAGLASSVIGLAIAGPPLPLAGAIASAAVVVGTVGGAVWRTERRRRSSSRAQLTRLMALERAAALREARERGAAIFREGTVIAGRYRLGPKLGVGASGAIWEATRLADGEFVAIKLLRAAVAHDTVASDRLRREAAALGLAWHPNVVEVYDEGHLPDGTSYLVMERLVGESLEARLRGRGRLAPDELLPIALQVCDALGAVHAAGVVHRDLKPSNIFLATVEPETDEDTSERVKILDFGIARVEWAETRLTNMGVPVGTPGYMSPEQEQGLEIDSRSDIYSLGGVLLHCLTGEPPPLRPGDLWSGTVRASRGSERSEANAAEVLFEAIPRAWRAVIERATSPLARDRYRDARAFREALLRLADSEPTVASGKP
jgi:serine/threonine-protein kinase